MAAVAAATSSPNACDDEMTTLVDWSLQLWMTPLLRKIPADDEFFDAGNANRQFQAKERRVVRAHWRPSSRARASPPCF